jgi:hypothetical protein
MKPEMARERSQLAEVKEVAKPFIPLTLALSHPGEGNLCVPARF